MNGVKLNSGTLLLAATISLLSACGGGGGGGGTPDNPQNNMVSNGGKKKWTYMIYLGGDNNLSTSGVKDINEMEMVGSDSNINVVVQAEFSNKYTNFANGYDGQTLRLKVEKDNNPNDVNLAAAQKIGNVDMAAPATLTDFVKWASTQYPAEHYALVVWDHGAGWKTTRLAQSRSKGAVQDETSGGFMTLPQLAQGVADAGVKLDIINFDACLMAMYEVAYQFKGLTDYMVFSEEVEPGDGDPYDEILTSLTATPAISAAELSSVIVDKYHGFYAASQRGEAVTKSAVDMSKMDALHLQVKRLAGAIAGEYASVSSVISGAQANSQSYHYLENHDLYDFANYLSSNLVSGATREAALGVRTAVEEAVIANKMVGSSMAGSHGLAIYVPTRNQVSYDNAKDDLASYGQLAINTPASESWHSLIDVITQNATDTVLNQGGFGFYLEWDTDSDLDLFVWEPCEPDTSKPCDDTLFAPYMGQTTPNGYFSGDSSVTGESREYYVANDYVEGGRYDILVNYYDDYSSNFANAKLWYIDPAKGVSEWTLLAGPIQLDLVNNPYPSNTAIDLDIINEYSDWWYPTNTSRVMEEDQAVSIAVGDRTVNLHVQRKKARPHISNGKD